MPNYVKNPTWADGSGGGTAITAAKLNNMESGIFDGHYQAAARVYRTTTQSLTDGVAAAIAFDAERFDTESNAGSTIHDNASNNTRLTCRTAGKYQISASIGFASNATGRREVYFLLNGTTIIGYDARAAVNGSATYINVSILYDLAVNDYVECWAFQNSTGALNVHQAGNVTPEFMMVRVA